MLRYLLLFLIIPTLTLSASWKIDPGTSVAVDVKWVAGQVEVRFPDIEGDISFDINNPQRARARISVGTRAATTGVTPADKLLKSADYLDADQFPTIRFELEDLKQTSKSTADVTGKITLRGITQRTLFKANVIRYGPSSDDPSVIEVGFDLNGEIDRTQFGSTAGVPGIATVLPVRIRLLISDGR